MKVPEENIFLNKKKICKDIYLHAIETLIRRELSAENLKTLEKGLSLRDQIFTLYWNNRFFTHLSKEEILENVNNCIGAYRFLLNSDLEPERIRNAFFRGLMDVISFGAGVHFLTLDFRHYLHEIERRTLYRGKLPSSLFPKRHRLWKTFRFKFAEILDRVEEKYPQIPGTVFQCSERDFYWPFKTKFHTRPFSLTQQLIISYSYPLFLLCAKEKIDVEKFEEEFFLKHRWCFERMSKCNPIFLNKYKEGICREISYDLGLDPDPSYFRWYYFQDNPISLTRNTDFLSQVTNIIVSCFSSEELTLFNETTSDKGLPWSLEDQIKDRYYSKYPSFAPMQEIKENIERKIPKYKPLLNKETAEVIREILFDEIERECFVSKPTHLWNMEMQNNLKEEGSKNINKRVKKAVNILIDRFPDGAIEQFEIEVSGRKFSLQEQLLARWKNAWFAVSLKPFQDYLSTLHIYTLYSIVNWKEKDSISKVDLQAFLEEIDMFFLYPNKGRIMKRALCKLDTGKTIGIFNIPRMNMIVNLGKIVHFRFIFIFWMFVIIAILVCLK